MDMEKLKLIHNFKQIFIFGIKLAYSSPPRDPPVVQLWDTSKSQISTFFKRITLVAPYHFNGYILNTPKLCRGRTAPPVLCGCHTQRISARPEVASLRTISGSVKICLRDPSARRPVMWLTRHAGKRCCHGDLCQTLKFSWLILGTVCKSKQVFLQNDGSVSWLQRSE